MCELYNGCNIEATLVTDKSLMELLNQELNHTFKEKVINKIQDQDNLKQIYETNEDWHVRTCTVRRITSQKYLYDVTVNAKEIIYIRQLAASKITNPKLLIKIINETSEAALLKEAVDGLTNEQDIFEVAKTIFNADIQKQAIAKLKDEENVHYIASRPGFISVRVFAINCLNNKAMLFDLICNVTDDEVLVAAARRVNHIS